MGGRREEGVLCFDSIRGANFHSIATFAAVYILIVLTQPTDARRVFPCWDEPIFKATFAITMISRMDTVNLSNMSVISEGVYKYDSQDVDSHPLLAKSLSSESASFAVEKWKITKFQTTPPVSIWFCSSCPFYFVSEISPDVDLYRGLRQRTFQTSTELV